MKSVRVIGALVLTVFFLISTYAVEYDLIKNQNIQLNKNDIIAVYSNNNRNIPIDYKNKIIKVYVGAKVTFKSKFFFHGSNKPYWALDDEKLEDGRSINYQFNTVGKYTVTLKIGDDDGNIRVSKLKVEVKEAQELNSTLPSIIAINANANPESKYSLEKLVEDVLVKGGCSTVDNFTVQVKGTPEDNTTKNYGYFNRGTSDFPFKDGVIITTGKAYAAGNTTTNAVLDSDNGLGNDTDVETALGINPTYDSSYIKFNFTPLTDNISFRFIMASEEYPEYECDYSDGFAFLLREVGAATYTNIAVLPDGTTPVSITKINNSTTCGANQEFFEGYQMGHTNYNGRTKVLTASSPVTSGTTYEIKLVVADALDQALDSAIFLEGGSFNLDGGLGDDITISAGTATCEGTSVEIKTESPEATHTWYLNGTEISGAGTGNILTVTEAGTYSVDIDFGGTNCTANDSVIVEFIPYDDATFTMAPSCNEATATITGTVGGVFSFNPAPTDGAIIDATTGKISNGTPGTTYNVEYKTPGTCSDSLIVPVVLLTPDDVSFTIKANCDGTATATINGETGGVFSFDPIPTDGAQIDSTTGTVTNGVVNTTYTIVYTISLNCIVTHKETLVILPPPTIVIPEPLVNCDDNVELDDNVSNDKTTFNLTSQNSILLDGQDPALHTVTYHFSQADADQSINPLTSPYENSVNPQTIYARIENKETSCYKIGEITLKVNPLPKIELDDRYGICVDSEGNIILPTTIIDTTLNTTDYSFEWKIDGEVVVGETNSTIPITEEGTYSVIATNIATGCKASKETLVLKSAPPIVDAEQVSITFIETNTILATATMSNNILSNGLFEFKLNEGPWVSNMPNDNTYTFENVPAGIHTITSRDIAGCGESSTTIIVLEFIPYFTPNGDGFHDTWNILGLENQTDAKLLIFDRYGKLIKEISVAGPGWDGTYNNNLMPSSDYWFTLKYRNPNTNIPAVFKSHFTLKR